MNVKALTQGRVWSGVSLGIVLAITGCSSPMPAQDSGSDAGPDTSQQDALDIISPTDATDSGPTNDTGDGGTTNPSMARQVASCGDSCVGPTDAVPTADGTTIYFTAFTVDGEPGIFRVPAGGGNIVTVFSGAPLEYPVGIAISPDNNTLYVADQSADRGSTPDVGAIFSIAVTGGSPSTLPVDMDLRSPGALFVTDDGQFLLVSAIRNSDRQPAAFQISTAGTGMTVVSADLTDPSGISQAPNGDTIIHDTIRAGERSAVAVQIRNNATTNYASGLRAGYPAGLAYSMDGAGALFSGQLEGGSGGLLTWQSAGQSPVNPPQLSQGMVQPLGLHRARTRNMYAVADDSATGNGAIFVVE